MTRLLSRTSITIDEAVSILLGLSTGLVDFEPRDADEDTEADAPVFCLRETLQDELEFLAGEYELAKQAKRPPEFIAEKQAAVQRQEAAIEQANLYLCAIQDELNKGEQSALQIDRVLSNAAYTFITLHSFNSWRQIFGGAESGAVRSSEPLAPSMEGTKKRVVRDKLNRQEDAILEEIRRQGFDPQALPPYSYDRPGVKAAVRESLDGSPPFEGSTTFEKAWGRLRKRNLVSEER